MKDNPSNLLKGQPLRQEQEESIYQMKTYGIQIQKPNNGLRIETPRFLRGASEQEKEEIMTFPSHRKESGFKKWWNEWMKQLGIKK